MIIKYSPMPGFKSGILMPIVPIILKNKKYLISVAALVDSGAASGVISTSIADELHIQWNKIPAKTGFSVGGRFLSHKVSVQAKIFDHDFFLDLNVLEGISPERCILGQADLFQKAKISFEAYKSQFDLTFRDFN